MAVAGGCHLNDDSQPQRSGLSQESHKKTRYGSIKKYAKEAEAYSARHNMDGHLCLLGDLGMHSGRMRLFVWDFSRDTLIASGLMSHGCGSGPWGDDQSRDGPVLSNAHDSHCSSAGRYRIGQRGYSQWGTHVKYVLHGLDASNSNALSRQIVLHGWDAIGDEEVYPEGTPEGWGCPAVSNRFMQQLDSLLRDRKKPVLLWLYR